MGCRVRLRIKNGEFMKISLIQVPFDFGFEEDRTGVGLGPVRLLEAGLAKNLSTQGSEVKVLDISQSMDIDSREANAVVRVNAALAKNVAREVADGAVPVVLAGGCSTCLGVLAGLDIADLGVIWFDAHADFNTPETTPSGFFDGMPLAIVAGRCYEELRKGIDLMHPIADQRILLLGVRDLDPGEQDNLEASKISVLDRDALKDRNRMAQFQSLLKIFG